MKDLTNKYDKLYHDSIEKVKRAGWQVDPFLQDQKNHEDNRFGITLLIRPPKEIKQALTVFLEALKNCAPQQYFYPMSDMHITVMSIIPCTPGFCLSEITVPEYKSLIAKSLQRISPFSIRMEGLTASPSCVMAQGFLANQQLQYLRDQLRENFRNACLAERMDERYAIKTAHMTLVRFREACKNQKKFLHILEKYRDVFFGEFTVNEVELVYNDWYQQKEKVQSLARFSIPTRNS